MIYIALVLVGGVCFFLYTHFRAHAAARSGSARTLPVVPPKPEPIQPIPIAPPQATRSPARTPAPSAMLILPESREECEIACSPFPIGRKQEDNLLVLTDDRISRHHAELQYQGHDWYIVDVGSGNGVFVNERRVSGALLRDGDWIGLGPYRLEFRGDEGEERREASREDRDVLERSDGFDLLQEIGRGGMAVVYKAVSVSSGRMVAVKVPLLEFDAGNREILDRFRAEARLTLRLRHPHIICVHHEGLLDDGRPYLVMEYLPGGSLRHHMLQTGGPLPETRIRAVGAQVAGALAYAHEQGVIHRDIKPENILFGERSEAKITDFGIALVEGGKRLTQAGPPVGTVHYQSPEQFEGTKTTAQTDLYALGCMLHEMATGQCPFEGTYAKVMYDHLHSPPPEARTRNPRISPGLSALILNLLNKSAQQRPADAAIVAAELAK